MHAAVDNCLWVTLIENMLFSILNSRYVYGEASDCTAIDSDGVYDNFLCCVYSTAKLPSLYKM